MNNHTFFSNKDCKYYPCHSLDDINCLFCYCPLFQTDCPGTPIFKDGVKDCSDCTFPHKKENYDTIINILKGNK